MSLNRTAILLAALAVGVVIGIALFSEELGQRALPPQARLAEPSESENASPPAADARASKDAALPAEPVAGQGAPSFEIVRIGSDCRAVLAGAAPAGALVIVKTTDGEIGRVTAAADSRWTLVPDLALKSGTKTLSLAAEMPGGAQLASEEMVVVVVPECRQSDLAAGGQVIVRLGGKSAKRQVLQVPGGLANGDGAAVPAVTAVDYIPDGALSLAGRARAGKMLQVFLNNAPVGTATANGEGNWRLDVPEPVSPGVYTVRVDLVAETGTVLTPQTGAGLRKLQWKNGGVVVQPGDTLWRIAQLAYGDGNKQDLIRRANRDRIRDGDHLEPGLVLFVPGVKPPEPEPAPPPAPSPQPAPAQ